MSVRIVLLILIGVGALAACTPTDEHPEPAGLENGSFTAELNGFNIHYEVHGHGPVVMTVPNSWGLTLEGLRGMYEPLEEHVTMVYFDPRGMGGSAAIVEDADMGMAAVRADFDTLRQHLGLEKVHAIGWSNGASNLVLLASEKPGILESAIFVHGSASFSQEDMKAWAEANPELFQKWGAWQQGMMASEAPVEEKNAQLKEFWLNEFFTTTLADPETYTEPMLQAFAEAGFSWPHAQYSQQEAPTFDAVDKLPLITARSLIVHGSHDMIQLSKAEEMVAGISDAELAVFENSGHYAPVEEKDAFVAKVTAFLGAESH